MSWRQKSRATWLKEGDRNPRFFHRMASMKNNINSITTLKVNGRHISNESQIRQIIEDYYKNMYAEPYPLRPELEGVQFDCISKED